MEHVGGAAARSPRGQLRQAPAGCAGRLPFGPCGRRPARAVSEHGIDAAGIRAQGPARDARPVAARPASGRAPGARLRCARRPGTAGGAGVSGRPVRARSGGSRAPRPASARTTRRSAAHPTAPATWQSAQPAPRAGWTGSRGWIMEPSAAAAREHCGPRRRRRGTAAAARAWRRAGRVRRGPRGRPTYPLRLKDAARDLKVRRFCATSMRAASARIRSRCSG